jgi:hypothetical protein
MHEWYECVTLKQGLACSSMQRVHTALECSLHTPLQSLHSRQTSKQLKGRKCRLFWVFPVWIHKLRFRSHWPDSWRKGDRRRPHHMWLLPQLSCRTATFVQGNFRSWGEPSWGIRRIPLPSFIQCLPVEPTGVGRCRQLHGRIGQCDAHCPFFQLSRRGCSHYRCRANWCHGCGDLSACGCQAHYCHWYQWLPPWAC